MLIKSKNPSLHCTGMLRSRRLSPPVEMGDSSYYALTADAKQLAAVVIAGAGAGVLTGLSTYELALANVKQEKKFPQGPPHTHAKAHTHTSTEARNSGDGKAVLPAVYHQIPSVTQAQQPCNKAALEESEDVTVKQQGSVLVASLEDTTSSERTEENGGVNVGDSYSVTVHDECTLETTNVKKEGMKVSEEDIEEEDDEATKLQKLQRLREIEFENEKECDCPLDDMSKDELKERILPFLAGDLFLIWRETDLATEKEKIRIRNKQLQIVENNEGVSEAVIEERRRLDAMTYDERTEHEKDKREEVVYTMLQEKYGLDEDKITDDAERLRKSSKGKDYTVRFTPWGIYRGNYTMIRPFL